MVDTDIMNVYFIEKHNAFIRKMLNIESNTVMM